MAVSHDQYYRTLARSMMLTIFLVSFTPLFLVTLIAGYQYSVAYKERVLAHLQELVLKHVQSVDDYLKEKVAEVQVLADVEGLDRFKNESGLEKLHQALLRRHGGDFVDLGLINSLGRQMAYSGPFKLQDADYGEAEWFKAVKEHKVYISDVFLGLRGVPHFIIALQLIGEAEEWFLRTTLDFVGFNRLVESIRIGETGLAFIINRDGEFQTTPRVDLTLERPLLRQLVARIETGENEEQDQVVVDILKNPATGRRTIFVSSPIKGGDWLMVYQQDMRDAFSQLDQARNLALLIVLLGGMGIMAMAFFMSRRMARKVEDADREKEMMNEQVIEAGKLASVGELAAGIAHEINNPVAIMVEEAGWIQDLLEDVPEMDDTHQEMRDSVAQIRTQGARCKEITHKLLSFARKIDPTVKRVELNDLIHEIVELCEQKAKYANVTVKIDLDEKVSKLEASPSELQQVFLNLINNAIDAMEPEGGLLKISSSRSDSSVVVSIADTGCGIPQANLSRIFDPFFTTKPTGKGTGLGLSIVYGIVNKMGGEISVKSALDKGTVFTIRLPVTSVLDSKGAKKSATPKDSTEVCGHEENEPGGQNAGESSDH